MTVDEYIEKQKKAISSEKEKSKKELLIRLGLFEREYDSLRESVSKEYPEFDYTKQRPYKYKIENLSDAQYEELLKYSSYNKSTFTTQFVKNSNEKILSVIGTVNVILSSIYCFALIVVGIVLVASWYDWAWTLIVIGLLSLPLDLGISYLFKVVADIAKVINNSSN